MPNRMLSGEIARSESLSRVSLQAELAFMHLISVADDFGRFDGRPAILLAALYPTRREIDWPTLEGWLAELEREGLLRWYEIGGRRYLDLPSWDRYQRKRAAKSKYPNPKGYLADDRELRADDSELLAAADVYERRETRGEDEKTPPQDPKTDPSEVTGSAGPTGKQCAEDSDPLGADRPLLNLLARLPGCDGEKEHWLADELPQLHADAAASTANGKPQQITQLAVRYYRAYLRGARPYANYPTLVEHERLRRANEAIAEEMQRSPPSPSTFEVQSKRIGEWPTS